MKSNSLSKILIFMPLVGLFASINTFSAFSAPKETNPLLDIKYMPKDGEMLYGDNEVLATLTLDNSSTLRFIKVGTKNIGVLEESPKDVKSISAVPGLSPKTPVEEVFYAFSKPGTPIPKGFQVRGKWVASSKKQGWARQFVAKPEISPKITSGNCNDTKFKNWFSAFPYNDRGTPVFRLNKVPRTSGYFEFERYKPGNGKAYDFYHYVVSGNYGSQSMAVDRYVTRVAVCNIDTLESHNPQGLAHPSISYQGYSNPHMGPVVRVMYRLPGQSTWKTASIKDYAANETGKTLSWHFYTGLNWDWRTDVYWAGADDSFDIGHAVEDL